MKYKLVFVQRSLSAFVSLLLVSSLLAGCGAKPAGPVQEELRSVQVTKAARTSVMTQVQYASKLQPVQEISVVPKTPAKVASVKFDVGQTVKQGDVLFTLDSKDVQVQLQQQQASLDVQRANLARTQDSGWEQQMISLQQAVDKTQVAYEDAKANCDRTKALYDTGAVTKQSLTDAENRLKNAETDLKTATENLNLFREKSGPQSVQLAQAQLQQAEAGVQSALIQMDNMMITAPISGTVSARNVEVGEMASSGMASFTIVDTSVLIAEISVPDKTVKKVAKGQKVIVTINALDNKAVEGVVDSVSPVADEKTRTYGVKVKLPNGDGVLTAGMFARVQLPEDRRENVVAVPREVIKMENGIAYIYIADGEVVRKKIVKTGLTDGKMTEITEGLTPDENVITEGQTFLSDGQKVTVVK